MQSTRPFSFGIALSVALILFFPAPVTGAEEPIQITTTAPATATDPAATGKKIGTIVSTAVDTAFPVIGKIMALFKNPNKPDEKVTQDAVKTAVTQAQTSYKATAKQQLQPITTIAKELGIIEAFSEAGVKANTNLITMKDLLDATSPDYAKVSLEWSIAKNQLADVLVIKTADISVVRDPIVRQRILDLQGARRDLMTRIDASLTGAKTSPSASTRQQLQTQTAAMAGLLSGFNSLASIELSFLQDDLTSLANWANGAAGEPSPAEKSIDPKLLLIVDKANFAAAAASKP